VSCFLHSFTLPLVDVLCRSRWALSAIWGRTSRASRQAPTRPLDLLDALGRTLAAITCLRLSVGTLDDRPPRSRPNCRAVHPAAGAAYDLGRGLRPRSRSRCSVRRRPSSLERRGRGPHSWPAIVALVISCSVLRVTISTTASVTRILPPRPVIYPVRDLTRLPIRSELDALRCNGPQTGTKCSSKRSTRTPRPADALAAVGRLSLRSEHSMTSRRSRLTVPATDRHEAARLAPAHSARTASLASCHRVSSRGPSVSVSRSSTGASSEETPAAARRRRGHRTVEVGMRSLRAARCARHLILKTR